MFKNHPKGLIPAALANMGERFGFYIMMAILTLFLMSKFNLDGEEAGYYYSIFYCSIYILALAGGYIADKTKQYKGTIIAGLLVMTLGYALLAIPALITTKFIALGALLVIAFGNGLFKGNLQAVVGQLYDDPKYSSRRDAGFQIFYMFINIGACIAPFIAVWVRNTFVKMQGFAYNADLPGMCHKFLGGKLTDAKDIDQFQELATKVSDGVAQTDLTAFAQNYLDAFNTGFHYAFSAAIVAMLISLTIFLISKKSLPDPAKKATLATVISKEEVKQSAQEIKQRILALFAVFGIVIFFWFSFHQNGLTLTMFAKDYTRLSIGSLELSAEIFQSINPFVVVFLTPVVMWIFGAMAKRGKEPSTPKKIGIGMGIAALAYIVMVVASIGLPNYGDITSSLPDAERVTPLVLFSVYFILTVAELFISPLGLAFVSKVAPAHLQGLMQGCWLGATAVGNGALFLGAIMYEQSSLVLTWGVFATVCFISMGVMFCMVKWLEKVAK
ncbi:MAG: peptide MFS transporter [Muribaculaceae bacterium]|nr:peptide MFS transporter [Muribaculaceae bacterium]